ncbi:hypothetical protein ACIRLA_41840 [Streptomyces sp. NPDC102364]|uniref:hypothetical protein n=1 Tax=Streptomyces sp. NPDC102364 TaxID=3366161 RepID=UPI0038016D03
MSPYVPPVPNFALTIASTASDMEACAGGQAAEISGSPVAGSVRPTGCERRLAYLGSGTCQRHRSARRQRGVTKVKPSILPYVFVNLGSPMAIAGLMEAWIQAPRPIASAVSITVCRSRSASICVRIGPSAPSGSFRSLLRNPLSTHFLTPAARYRLRSSTSVGRAPSGCVSRYIRALMYWCERSTTGNRTVVPGRLDRKRLESR